MQRKNENAEQRTGKIKKHTVAVPKANAYSLKLNIKKKTDNNKTSKDKKTLLIAEEVKFARFLSSNDKKIRDKVFKNLKKWLTLRSKSSLAFIEADFIRLWKGLFCCMWMSDKLLVQENLAESISNLVHCFNSKDNALLYTKCTFRSLAVEWFGIDRYRVDKFEMLVRRIIRQTFVSCKNQSWDKQWVIGFGEVFKEVLLDPKTCLGLNLHITDVYMEELAKICKGQIPKNIVTELVRPFVIVLVSVTDQRQVRHISKSIFRYLIFQSDIAMEYTEKFIAWREVGFSCTNINEIQKFNLSDEGDNFEFSEEETDSTLKNKESDPRAGRVNVEIPQIPFDPAEVAKVLEQNKFHKLSTAITRKYLSRLIDDFNRLANGNMPYGIKEFSSDNARVNLYDAAKEFISFEKNIYFNSSKNRKRKYPDNSKVMDLNSCLVSIISPQNKNSSMIKLDYTTRKFVDKKQHKKSKKSISVDGSNVNDSPVNKRTPSPKSSLKQKTLTESAQKRVKIVLQLNMAQNTSEYIQRLKQSPAIPFDAHKKPKTGVLKRNSLPSPINPFYRNKIFSYEK